LKSAANALDAETANAIALICETNFIVHS